MRRCSGWPKRWLNRARLTLPTVFLGLGSNLGERDVNIREALASLEAYGVRIVKVSKMIETDPVGGPPQGLFLNAAAKVDTALLPQELLAAIHKVEASLGRVRAVKDGPRTIDIDILLYGDQKINFPELIVPHPRMWERDFVLRPLREVAPELFA